MKNDNEKMNIPFSKPKTLHELLKQGSGHNLVLDFSLLSKRGGLINKAKKLHNENNQKISEVNIDKTKISKNFEILSKLGKKKKKIEQNENIPKLDLNNNNKNIIENELINDFNNKINLTKIETDRNNNLNINYNDNRYPDVEYDNPPLSEYRENTEKKNYSNTKIKKSKINPNSEIKNNFNFNNNYLYEQEQDQEEEQKMLNYSNFIIPEQQIKNSHNKHKKIININSNTTSNKTKNNYNRPFVIAKSPNIEVEEFDEDYNEINTKKINKKKYYNKNNIINQIIEYETIKESYTIKHCNCVLEYSFREDQNIDSEILMEDKSKSIENFNNDKNQMLFEIFDGHGGDEISTYLQNNLAKIYKQNLLLNKGNIILSLKNAFHDADDEMRDQLNIEGLGSTGTLVHIVKNNFSDELVVYSANVGDSRVSLISPEHIIRLSYDHRTSDEKEKKRILESGMDIIDDRICGTLMLTRIFGNYEYKEENEEKNNDINNNKGLICEPFISKINIDSNIENQFLIIASDGIWDILTEEDIQKIIQKYQDTQKICSIIIKKCLENEAWDNMSVFAVKLT
jgi:serine/threonine protein phosphatase PrpC